MSLARNIEFLRQLPKLHGLNTGLGRGARRVVGGSPLVETTGFGTNPGELRMLSYLPETLAAGPALVVVLHGCGQTAAGYDLGAGWSLLAKHYGFALLMPEQQLANNAQNCFNWFAPQDSRRGSGEASSIRQMIARMASDHKIDPHRIFITGLSAGGAMTSVMLAAYPEVFAAGAIIAGLPYGVATNVREALNGMFQSPARSSKELGDLVRGASRHRGAWPKVSVWHGSADRTVNPANADQILKQWLDVHRLPSAPMSEGTVDGYPHQVWWNSDGETIVESYTITDMAHGTPIGMAENDQRYGVGGAFLIEAGISSSYHIAKFFGLTSGALRPAKPAVQARPPMESPSARLIPVASPVAPAALPTPPDLGKVLWPLAIGNPPPKPAANSASKSASKSARKPAADSAPKSQEKKRASAIGAVITRALAAAGLVKQAQ